MKTISLLKLHQHACLLEVEFECGFNSLISWEMLRVYAPQSQHQTIRDDLPLITGKAFVQLTYAALRNGGVQLTFDDEQPSVIYSPGTLYQLCNEQDRLWLNYLNRCKLATQSREHRLPCKTLY